MASISDRARPRTRGRSQRGMLAASGAWAILVVAIAAVLADVPAHAVVVGGGGNETTDCLTVFDATVNYPPAKPRDIRCTDGAGCDADHTVNGVCQFPLAVCANSTFDAACTLNGVETIRVEHSADNGDPRFDPAFQALATRVTNEIDAPTTTADKCTQPTNFFIAIKGPFGGTCKKNTKTVKLVTVSKVIGGRIYTDKDKIRLTCEPDPDMCDAQLLFGGNTFDRIQNQIFDQSCAVSGCHDSQSMTGGLLLETGASYDNLVNATPTNGAAIAAGWKRVTVIDADTGDPDTSLLYAKVSGPPEGFGARMPFNRKPIDRRLIEVIRLWIAAGAPKTGLVPGTD